MSGARASSVSRIIKARAGKRVSHLAHVGQSRDGSSIVYTVNGTRHQAAAVSAARRVLLGAGYEVETRHGRAGLPMGEHTYYLVVTK